MIYESITINSLSIKTITTINKIIYEKTNSFNILENLELEIIIILFGKNKEYIYILIISYQSPSLFLSGLV